MKNAKGRSHRCRNITVKNVSTGLGCEYIAHPRDNGPDQSVQAHLLGVADKAKSRAAKIDLGVQGELIGLVHDLGKYSKDFQDYIRSAVDRINPDEDDYVDAKKRKGKVDHSTAGAQLIWQTLAEQGQLGQIVGQILALCVAQSSQLKPGGSLGC